MGLLTDPSAGQGKIIKALVKYHMKLCVLLYIAGVIWFGFLAYAPLNTDTYFSENALLPGLVKSEFRDEGSAVQFYNELQDEISKYDNSIPYPWLLGKLHQIGLDTYTHNFTLNYPLGKSPKKFTGKNVYGILRAARAASTEAVVMSVPYRPPSNINPTTLPSIAIMLAFAKFANKEKYWSKDIIFLITEHEQLGIQAWLEAYHTIGCGHRGVLEHGDLQGRGGAIQAAINLEFHDVGIGRIDMKVEGLNGQLPNLDLFNLAIRMCSKEYLAHTFKNRENKSFKDGLKDWNYSFKTLMAMVFSQATGIPNGNHGLFHRFGIQAITMEGFSTKQTRSNSNFLKTGRILEGIFRSLNNLLERFHQSYFFYLLPASDRFISIGLYIPTICLIAGALFIKAYGKWCKLQQELASQESEETTGSDGDTTSNKNGSGEPSSPLQKEKDEDMKIFELGTIFMATHGFGLLLMKSPILVTNIGAYYGYSTELSIYISIVACSVILLSIPYFISIKTSYKMMTVWNVLCHLELGTVLICLSMYNFSLGFLASALYVPFVLLLNPSNCRPCLMIQRWLWLLVHPLVVLTTVVLINTFVSFPGETFSENLVRGFAATQTAVVFSIVDYMIYSNWLYGVVSCILLPNWLCFWLVPFYVPQPTSLLKKNE